MAVVQNGNRAGLNLLIPPQKGLILTGECGEGTSVFVCEWERGMRVTEVCVVMKQVMIVIFKNTLCSCCLDGVLLYMNPNTQLYSYPEGAIILPLKRCKVMTTEYWIYFEQWAQRDIKKDKTAMILDFSLYRKKSKRKEKNQNQQCVSPFLSTFWCPYHVCGTQPHWFLLKT